MRVFFLVQRPQRIASTEKNLIIFRSTFNSNLERNFRISRHISMCVYLLFLVSYFSYFSPVAIFLYPPPDPLLFFTRTISSAAFNLNASLKIFPSLVCRFLNRYVLFLSLFLSLSFFLSSPLLSTFSLAFAHEERAGLLCSKTALT